MTSLSAIAAVAVAVAAATGGAAPPAPATGGVPPGMALVPGGVYAPLFARGAAPRTVAPFHLDLQPVTNQEFLEFVRENPKWQRSNRNPLFADQNYLRHWAGDLELGPAAPPGSAVTHVSWFAARAFLKARGKRLPTEDEWEFAARADGDRPDATGDPAFLKRILDWYSMPTPETLPAAAGFPPNVYGVRALHGLVWEWVRDFNNATVTGESRGDSTLDRNLFCAGGALLAADPANYSAYMRYAFRSSLKGNYTVANLGFRGALDATGEADTDTPDTTTKPEP